MIVACLTFDSNYNIIVMNFILYDDKSLGTPTKLITWIIKLCFTSVWQKRPNCNILVLKKYRALICNYVSASIIFTSFIVRQAWFVNFRNVEHQSCNWLDIGFYVPQINGICVFQDERVNTRIYLSIMSRLLVSENWFADYL